MNNENYVDLSINLYVRPFIIVSHLVFVYQVDVCTVTLCDILRWPEGVNFFMTHHYILYFFFI